MSLTKALQIRSLPSAPASVHDQQAKIRMILAAHWMQDHKAVVLTWLVGFSVTVAGCMVYALPQMASSADPVMVRLLASRIVFVNLVAQLVMTAALLRDRTQRLLQEFFTAPAHPLNLAVFRVVLFYSFLMSVRLDEIVRYSQLPAGLRVTPEGIGRLLLHLPINESWARAASILLMGCCWTGMLGVFSRTSALLAALLGTYALGIPQCFGKVNHYHHLIWFALILAASRCGDALSLDAFIAARRRAKQDLTQAPVGSQVYGLPLRFVWLLMGVLYFFPGFWKVWTSGFDWALGDNLRFQLYAKWFELDGWMPFFRIDHYPLLYRLAGLGTLIFETSFIILVFFPRLRPLAVSSGLAFHTMTKTFMRISFASLELSYVTFVDWHALGQRIGRLHVWPVQALIARLHRSETGVSTGRWLERHQRSVGQAVGRVDAIPRAVAWVGILLVSVNLWFGFRNVMKAWPFACYPTFARIARPEVTSLTMVALDASGNAIPFNESLLKQELSSERWRGMTRTILSTKDDERRARRLNAFWRMWVTHEPGFQRATTVRFYQDTVSTVPEQRGKNPLKRELLLDVAL